MVVGMIIVVVNCFQFLSLKDNSQSYKKYRFCPSVVNCFQFLSLKDNSQYTWHIALGICDLCRLIGSTKIHFLNIL